MISTCILAKDSSDSIKLVIDSVKEISSEIIVVDDHSKDFTRECAAIMGAKVIPLPFHVKDSGFAVASNWLLDQATQEWILFIDSDELLGNKELLHPLTRYPGKEVWALPRRKWLSYPTARTEYEAYPDWQIRFFKNNQDNRFEGEMHIRLKNKKHHYAYRGPHIEHLQDQFRTEDKLVHREHLYKKLAAKQGVAVERGYILERER